MIHQKMKHDNNFMIVEELKTSLFSLDNYNKETPSLSDVKDSK